MHMFVQLFMFKCHHNILPSVFQSFYVYNLSVHDHFTRQLHQLHVPLAKSTLSSTTVRISGVKCYNYFVNHISLNMSYDSYKYNLRRVIREHGILDIL